jgi:hypothetical protein
MQMIKALTVVAALAAAQPLRAQQPATSPAVNIARSFGGAAGGAAVGALLGIVAGHTLAPKSDSCKSGNSDRCLDDSLYPMFWGFEIGSTIGAPVGAHYANRSRGDLRKSLGVSAALFVAEALTLRSLVHDGQTAHKSTVFYISIGVPILQVVTSTILER